MGVKSKSRRSFSEGGLNREKRVVRGRATHTVRSLAERREDMSKDKQPTIKGTKRTKELWEEYCAGHRASTRVLEDLINTAHQKPGLFKFKERPQREMIEGLSFALAQLYLQTEDRRGAFWDHARELGCKGYVNYNAEKNILTHQGEN